MAPATTGLLLVAVAALLGPAPAGGQRSATSADAIPVAAAPVPPAGDHAPDSTLRSAVQFLLRPGDQIRLRVWREPDISGEYKVDEEGAVVFPMLGRLAVTTDSPMTLKARLVEGYRVYLRNPSIDVELLRRVQVLGAVRTPGLYPADATMTIADMIALAGGAMPQGRSDRVLLRREGRVLVADLAGPTRLGELPIRSGDQLFVPDRPWIARNGNVVAGMITALASLTIALFLRH